ncbi:MAG: ABC transporter substrate-binding protein, partial [Lachnospiraceae bacterium]|nr:ABC transporter substrate-binding protein [Lachnospiraceae bacterium]
MKSFAKKLALIMATVMVLSTFAACGEKAPAASTEASTEAPASTETSSSDEAAASTDAPATEVADSAEKTLVVGYDTFSSKFSPFFATSAYDQDAAAMVTLSMLNSDREGNVVTKGVNGEVRPFNGTDYTYYAISDLDVVENADGTVDYTFKMRDDVKFSDGTPVTINDAIFSLYVLCDPTYDGSSTVYALPIVGMDEYRSGMDTTFNLLVAAGKDNTDFSLWDEATQTAFWADVEQAGAHFVQDIIDYCVAAGYATAEDPAASVIALWGFEAPEGATTAEIFDIMLGEYGNDLAAMTEAEKASTGAEFADLMENYAAYATGVETGASADHISGIVKNDDYSMTIKLSKVDATAIYQMDLTVAPMHYYGDASLYDYDNNKFGFNKGDISIVKDKTTKPLGGGAYKFVNFENGVITYEANENYYLGTPVTKYVQFKETPSTDKLTGVTSGTFDITDPSMNLETLKNIKSYNSNGEVSGDVITTALVDNLGYGYMGISAHNVAVGETPDSEESKSLRKAFATLFACYRDTVINSYYGEMASVIQYPISNTSWAAPKPADEGYRLAYSV